MSLDGLSSVQSRISAIQEKIQSLQNNGRPPVSITESSSSTSTSSNEVTNTKSTTSTFATELAKQVENASTQSVSATDWKGKVQGIPGSAEAFVEKVKSHLGVPYVWGGTDPDTGLDCSGLVQTSAKEVGVNLPRVTYDQQHAGTEVASIDEAKPGDLIILRNSGHVAVYIGDGKAIHAPRPGQKVTEADVNDLGPIVTIRRVMRSADDAPAAGATPTTTSVNTAATQSSNAALAALLTGTNGVGGNQMLSSLMGGTGLGTGSATSGSNDLAASLVGALSGSGAATGSTSALTQMLGSTNSNNSYSSTLLSQFMGGSSLYASGNAAGGLNSLLGTGTANGLNTSSLGAASSNASLANTASSMSALAALRGSLGV